MQNQTTGAWPMAFFSPHLHGMPLTITHSNKPRVGLGVVCRCISQSYSVECLLLKRGPKFVSPLKWSFPGGRLDEDGDTDDDGERCTIRELKKECGGGSPGGLPPLIHIESYKAGKTLYHVFVIDCEAQPVWLNWKPSVTSEHTGEIDQSATELVLQGKKYLATNGFCWVDMQTLIEECMSVSNADQEKVNMSVLQHGLVRWVKANGESILKMLMARSPKLERHRRYPSTGSNSTMTTIQGKSLQLGGRPRSGSAGSRVRKPPGPLENHMYTTPMIQPVYRPSDPFGNHMGGAPMMQMAMPPVGTIPDFLKLSHDPNSQIPPQPTAAATTTNTTVELSQMYHSPLPGNILPPVPPNHDSTTPSHSSQHSPVKTTGINDQEKQISLGGGGGTGFVPLDGNGESIDITQQQQHHHLYGNGNLLPLQMAIDSSTVYDPNSYQTQQQQFHHIATTAQVGGGPDSGVPPNSSNFPPNSEQHSRYHNHRRNDVCRNYLNGHCLYGEKCWFLHTDQKPHREPLLGPGGILNASHSGGMLPPQAAAVFPGGMGMEQYIPHYPSPKSPLGGNQVNSTGTTPAWQIPGIVNRPAMFPFIQRGLVGGPQPPQVLLRPFLYQNRFPVPQNDHIIMPVPDPVLRFRLLSEGMMKDTTGSLVSNVTSLAVRADHVFVTFQKHLRDYKVLFGSDKPQDNHHLTGEYTLSNDVTCLHISKITPLLLVIGTAGEGVFTYDMKRNVPANTIVPLNEPQQSDAHVTALVHFTTVAAAQVVVAGNSKGEVTWYIAQPPMKTFTVLANQKIHIPSPVVCLQIFGGCLVSGSSSGMVCLWNMRTPEPELSDSFQAHSQSLLNIHVLDTMCFITVGANQEPPTDAALPGSAEIPAGENTTKLSDDTSASSEVAIKNNIDDTLSSGVTNLSLTGRNQNFCLSLWEYSKPIKNVRTLDSIGPVTCSAFYQHPLLGNRFLALGLMGGAVKIYNIPAFTIASEIHFQDIAEKNCCHIALNLSREKENTYNFNMKNPFRDLILTTVWSDGRIMVCQVDPRKTG